MTLENGIGRLPDGTICSSGNTFDADFALFAAFIRAPFDEIWPTASTVPARIAGVSDRKGTLELHKDADLTALTDAGEVLLTVVGGEVIR